ncbi:inhibitor of apoptosis-promoting Bax1-domain-containing protein [Chytriomyces sp. MP71]|nr:inhibitor of apoptosis-promoting Bax1-domain-containing protein [Chytriomyces sp. MP71]
MLGLISLLSNAEMLQISRLTRLALRHPVIGSTFRPPLWRAVSTIDNAVRHDSLVTRAPKEETRKTRVNTFSSRAKQLGQLTQGAIVIAGSAAIIDRVFNSETELLDGIIDFDNETENPSAIMVKSNESVRLYLNATYSLVGMGVFLTCVSAYSLSLSPLFQSLMVRNPVAVTVSSMMASGMMSALTLIMPPSFTDAKHGLFSLFAVTKGVFLSSLIVMSPPLLGRVGLYSSGLMGSMSYIAANTRSDQYIYMGGPLLSIVTVATLSANVHNILPAKMHVMPKLYAGYLYAGLFFFGFFVVRDMGRVVRNGREVVEGRMERDIVKQAVQIYEDFLSVVP